MKGIHGLIVAIGLGIAGALINFAYLYSKSRDVERVGFIGIKPKVTVARGEPLREEHLEEVLVPRMSVGNLKDFAVLYSARQTVIGSPVWRTLAGGSLLLQADLRTPPPELSFGQNLKAGVEERAMFVPIDTRRIVPSLIEPGDYVTFLAPGFDGNPTPAGVASSGPGPASGTSDSTDPEAKPGTLRPEPAGTGTTHRRQPADGIELIGPFKILSLGNRLGSAEVMRAARIPQTQENVMTILVRLENGKLQPEAARLVRLLEETNYRPLGYLLHPRTQRRD
ncbi:MAG: hypothetical protein ACUVUC_01845 [Thermoguttaceae bacterium]